MQRIRRTCWVIVPLLIGLWCGVGRTQEREITISGKGAVERLTRLEEGQKRLEEGQRQLGELITRLEDGQRWLGKRLTVVEEGQRGLDKRIDDLGRQIDRLVTIVIGGIGVTFAGMFALVGFVLWDRRSALAPAVRRIEELREREERIEAALREYATRSPDLAESLKKVGLL